MDNGKSSYRRFLDGDESGFVEIVEMYSYNLIFFINGFVNNVAAAEDLMEETFCDLLFYKNRFKEKSLFKTYLFSIARNKVVDYIKKSSRTKSVSFEDMGKQIEDLNKLENIVIGDESKLQINKALLKINPEYRAVLHLLYFEEQTHEQAALILNKNNKQIKNLVFRAKQSLKIAMEQEGYCYEK